MRKGLILLIAISILLVSAIFLVVPADTILDDFQVNTEFPGHPPQDSPYSVANWQTQRIYATFLSQHDGTNWDVALARHNYDLQPIGQTTYLNVREGTYNCLRPKLVIRSTGVGAAWIEARSPNRILFRSMDGNGNPTCPPVRVEDDFSNVPRDSLSIAALYDGFLLVWYDGRDSSKIWAQKVNLSGQLIDPNFPIQPDSTGSILGLEAQNHPDGRVLVSWVTNGQYSRGRWLDSLGTFMGEVFGMAQEGYWDGFIGSTVSFGLDGYGILYQYGAAWGIYLTPIGPNGIQVDSTQGIGAWYGVDWMPGQDWVWYDSFPDILCWERFEYAAVYHHTFIDNMYGYSSFSNVIYSSLAGASTGTWGVTYQYRLCRLNDETLLYSSDPGCIALREYQFTDLDSSSEITWIFEPGFTTTAQHRPDIVVQENGDFRVIYNNDLSAGTEIYTRYFNSSGVPHSDDTLASFGTDLSPALSSLAHLERASGGKAFLIYLVAGSYSGTLKGTAFTDEIWNGEVFNMGSLGLPYGPMGFDINGSDHLELIWGSHSEDEFGSFSQEYFRAFSQLHVPLGAANEIGEFSNFGEGPVLWDIALRDDGHFAFCLWPSDSSQHELIQIMSGQNYGQVISDTSLYMPANCLFVSSLALENSPAGYWLAWDGGVSGTQCSLYLQQVGPSGQPQGPVLLASTEDFSPIGNLDLSITPGGSFALVWRDNRNDSGDIYCRQFNPDGSFFGNEYRVNSDPVGVMQKEPAVAFGPEDRLYFTWTDFRNTGGQGDIFCKVIEWEDALDAPVYQPLLPRAFALFPPSPNPFNAVTAIRYQLPADSFVSLRVYDTAGRLIKTLVDGRVEAGSHQALFDGSDLASGIYIARLQAGDYVGVEKLVLLK